MVPSKPFEIRSQPSPLKLLALILTLPDLVDAQPPGIQELSEANSAFHAWYFSVSSFVLVLGAICGIVGGLRVYAHWNIGHHHHHPVDTQIIGWFLSCLFLTLVGSFLKALYGI